MNSLQLCLPACCAVGVAVACAGRLPAQAINMYYRNQLNSAATQPVPQTQATAAPTVAPPASYVPPPQIVPYGGYGYGYGYGAPVYSPYGGYLNGVANVTNAYGQYLMQTQQARLSDQQVQQARIQTQRQLFDERRYELANTPTLEELRTLEMQQAYQRAMNNPPNTEIWDGSAPNVLFKAARAAGVAGPAIPLDPRPLQQINFTTGTARGGAGALTTDRFQWPLILTGPAYASGRQTLEELTPQAVEAATSGGGVPPQTLERLNSTIKAMQDQLDAQIADMTPDDYIRGKRYLRELKEGYGVLGAADAKLYLDRGWLRGVYTVPQLVAAMSQRGLAFAPAAPGQEAAYTVLFGSLVAYNSVLSQAAGGGR